MKTLLKSQRSGFERGRATASLRVLVYATVLALAVFLASFAPAGASTTSNTVRDVRFGDHIGYERAVIDLGTRQEPGGLAPTYRSSYRDGDSVVRVGLPTTKYSLTTGGSGLGRAISRYDVVRSQAGSLSVYFHLTAAASSTKVFKLDHPARVVLDVKPGGGILRPKPAIGNQTVVLKPRAGESVGPETFTVKGYGRPFEAQGAWRVVDTHGRIVREGTYTTSDWAATWGSFAFTTSYPHTLAGTKGRLEVGQYSLKNSFFEGVFVPLKFR